MESYHNGESSCNPDIFSIVLKSVSQKTNCIAYINCRLVEDNKTYFCDGSIWVVGAEPVRLLDKTVKDKFPRKIEYASSDRRNGNRV